MHQMKLLERNVNLMEEADSWSCVFAGSCDKLTAIPVDDCNVYFATSHNLKLLYPPGSQLLIEIE